MGKFSMGLKKLEAWFDRQKRILPWRNLPSLYRVWVSEIMLQQTQVQTVIPYFEKFLARFPSVKNLAEASEEEVIFYWQGLGYYSRARNLHKGAKLIVQNGFPKNREGWLEIPGVGDYTAGAILSIAEDQPEPILDGNVERVVSRLRLVGRQQGDKAFKLRLWKIARILVTTAYARKIRPSVLNQALMELGATICTPKNPRCNLCPLSDLCRANARGCQEEFPPRKKPKKWLSINEKLHCVIRERGSKREVLMRLRNKGEWRSGLWDFLENSPEDLDPLYLGEVETRHVVTQHKITRQTSIWKIKSTAEMKWQAAEPSLQAATLRWVSFDDPEVALGSAARKTLKETAKLVL